MQNGKIIPILLAFSAYLSKFVVSEINASAYGKGTDKRQRK
jgi:hypothetical protein